MISNARIAGSRSLVAVMPLVLIVFAVMTGLSAPVYGDIVVDGGFESADPGGVAGATDYFTSGSSIDGGIWNVTEGTVGVDTQNFYVFDGNKSVFLDGDSGGPDSLTQTLTTVIGQTYTVGFWADADVPNTFSVTFGGAAVTGTPSSIAINGFPSGTYLGNSSLFTFYSGTATATSTSTDLVFTATGFPAGGTGVTVEIDDVSAVSASTTVPEPGTLGLLSIGLLGLGLIGYARRTNYSRR